jgi:hypothetical protein
MGSFGNFVLFTVKRKLSMTPMFQQCLLPYFTKWVRLGALEARKFPKKPQYFRHCFNICYMFYQMGSFGNFLFWALDFIYLTLIRAGLNQPNSNRTRLIAIT